MGATSVSQPSDSAGDAGGAREAAGAANGTWTSAEVGGLAAAAAASVRIAPVRVVEKDSTHHCDANSEAEALSLRIIRTDWDSFVVISDCR